MKNKKINFKAFTLVELIIVITILAILATIAFISFQNYTKSARDGSRLSTLNSMQKGLELYLVKTGNLPIPDNQTGTGQVNSQTLAYVGVIGDNISRQINFNITPKDPLSKTNYVYGIDVNKTKYQIATVLEDTQASNIFISKIYADDGYKAKVIGNYNGLLLNGNKIYNLPSLVFTNTGVQDLTQTGINFVSDKLENLPYLIGNSTILNTLSPTQVLQKQTNNTGTITLTGIIKPSTMDEFNSMSGVLLSNLGYSLDTIGVATLGSNYISNITSNTGTTTVISFNAIGGLINTYYIGGLHYQTHTFTTVGTGIFQITSGSSNLDYLVVGGGGGGAGQYYGGGGGGGGFLTGSVTLSTGSYLVTVGKGGTGTISGVGGNGLPSIINFPSAITANGGGGGGFINGASGASGGGAGKGGAGTSDGSPGTTSSAGQGNDGGQDGSGSGGGGGGAGGVGGAGSGNTGGIGGIGKSSSISGNVLFYSGGGGGGGASAGGASGGGGGGTGGIDSGATSGVVNTGGGGGGCRSSIVGSGGSGIVIIRYLIP